MPCNENCDSPQRRLLFCEPREAGRLSAFAIAVATSSVNEASRASVSAGSGSSAVEAAVMTPHRRPSTTIGLPTADR